MAEILEQVGERIRSLRNARALSQQALAEKAGISYKYLGEVERGQVNVSVEVLVKIASAMGVAPGMLLDSECPFEIQKEIDRVSALMTNMTKEQRALVVDIAEAVSKHTSVPT